MTEWRLSGRFRRRRVEGLATGRYAREMSKSTPAPPRASTPLSWGWIVWFTAVQMVLWIAVLRWYPPEFEGPTKVAVGLWPGTETLTIARQRGILREDSVRMIEMIWSSAAMRAFSNKAVDAAVLSLDEALRLRLDGHDVRIMSVLDVSAGADALMVRDTIHETGALRGKRIGVEVRTSGVYLLARALQRAGMTMKDVEIVPLNVAETESALLEGEVAAVVTTQPWQSRLAAQGAVRLFDSSMIPGELCRVLVARGDGLKTRRNGISRIIAAHFEMLPQMAEGLTQSEKAIIARRESLDWDAFLNAARTVSSLSKAECSRIMRGKPSPLDEMAGKCADFMVENGLLRARPDLRGWIVASEVKDP